MKETCQFWPAVTVKLQQFFWIYKQAKWFYLKYKHLFCFTTPSFQQLRSRNQLQYNRIFLQSILKAFDRPNQKYYS